MTSSIPVDKPLNFPDPVPCFCELCPPFFGVKGKEVQPASLGTPLYQNSFKASVFSREALLDGGILEITGGAPRFCARADQSGNFFARTRSGRKNPARRELAAREFSRCNRHPGKKFPARAGSNRKKSGAIASGCPGYFPFAGYYPPDRPPRSPAHHAEGGNQRVQLAAWMWVGRTCTDLVDPGRI